MLKANANANALFACVMSAAIKGKKKTLVFERYGRCQCIMRQRGEELDVVDECRCLGVKFSKEGNGKATGESSHAEE